MPSGSAHVSLISSTRFCRHRLTRVTAAYSRHSMFGPSALPPTMASADFWCPIATPLDVASSRAEHQISPGMTHPPSRLCLSDLRRIVPCMYRALHFFACSPRCSASIRFLFVRPALCLRLPPDSQSPATPLPSANTSPCRVCRGLSPPSECALPGAQRKTRRSGADGQVPCPKPTSTGARYGVLSKYLNGTRKLNSTAAFVVSDPLPSMRYTP
jgi:hypothetical protein